MYHCYLKILYQSSCGGTTRPADMGVQVIGILGVLLEAKSNGLIDRVKPIVDDLIAIAGFRISQQLYAEILQAAKESL